MADKKEQPSTSTPKSSAGAPPRPTITLPPRPFGEVFFNGGIGFSPGPMTLVSNLFPSSNEYKSFSQLLAGAMASPEAASAAAQQRPGSSGDGGGGGGNSSGDMDPRFKQNRPTGLMITQPPTMFTVPPGLSPATLLDSPSFLGLLSPIQGTFGMSHQQALAQVTAQAVQANTHLQTQPEYLSMAPPTSFVELPSVSTAVSDSSLAQKESSELSISVQEQRSQLVNVDKPATDGYNWRKYGQKQVKGSEFPRSYYKCTNPGCPVKKKVERSLDGQATEIIYKGQHNHQPPQNNKRGNRDSSNPNGSSDTASQFQASSFNKTRRDHEASQATMTDQISEASDSEEVGNAQTGGEERDEDEPDPKRRSTEIRVSEHAASHRTVTEPRIIVQTNSEVDLLDDGYRWRKYGQKVVKGNPYPRSYYKCTTPGCNVRKHVERAATDAKAVITTYEGKHNHDIQLRLENLHASANLSHQPIARLRLKEEQSL
ncbi:PREDICTED: probable WRKY transcription factor 4 [Tarenaya hassleriana]|uniref:probable WRKY transcription factor 4 n=1 Tax=Tarenaya hassleriana TaxID=28532 RepID=UPI00053C4EF1|nr:PREDICTED: probable WRKY transcription factor 4 [Tarenaya hassleriana]